MSFDSEEKKVNLWPYMKRRTGISKGFSVYILILGSQVSSKQNHTTIRVIHLWLLSSSLLASDMTPLLMLYPIRDGFVRYESIFQNWRVIIFETHKGTRILDHRNESWCATVIFEMKKKNETKINSIQKINADLCTLLLLTMILLCNCSCWQYSIYQTGSD